MRRPAAIGNYLCWSHIPRLPMLEIDGSQGEGGGQILRTSIALSALTMKPIRVFKIRAGRAEPGLKKQHMAGVELVGQIVNAEIEGLEVGSMEVTFRPRERRTGRFKYDVGTAGSISLVLQAVLIPAIVADSPIEFEITGGTDVQWSPPVDYINNVFTHAMSLMGTKIELTQIRRGHYPKGGGLVRCRVTPVDELTPIRFKNAGPITRVRGISHCVQLPVHVAKRQATSAEDILKREGLENIEIREETYPRDKDPHLGPGSGIVLWTESDTGLRLGADCLGERGRAAEDVGKTAAQKLIDAISTHMAADSHLADMLVPYMAIASGESQLGITEITTHLLSNIWVVEQILGVKTTLDGKEGASGLLTIQGGGMP